MVRKASQSKLEDLRAKLLEILYGKRFGVENEFGDLYKRRNAATACFAEDKEDIAIREEANIAQGLINQAFAKLKEINRRIEWVKSNAFSNRCPISNCGADMTEMLQSNPLRRLCVECQKILNNKH